MSVITATKNRNIVGGCSIIKVGDKETRITILNGTNGTNGTNGVKLDLMARTISSVLVVATIVGDDEFGGYNLTITVKR
jgi:hypothetical protein